MKKLLCFLLAFAMLFTSVAASAAISADKVPEFLDKAGIVKAGTFTDEAQLLTRGEFAQMVAKLIPLENYKGLSTTQIFNDVPTDSPIFDVTTLLYKLYFIVGDGNGNFEPDAPLTAEAACKILVNLMGDQYFATYYGGYIPAAANKGILNGVELSEGQTVSVKAAMKMIYNTMVADISNSNTYDGNAVENNPAPEMFMSRRLGIYTVTGVVEDDGITSLSGDTKIKKDQIKIGTKVYENQTGMEDLLGYTVEGFYRYDSDADKNVLIFAYINENRTNIIELDEVDIARYSDLTYEYYTTEDQDEIEEAYLNPDYRIIYNGHAYSTETQEASFAKEVNEMLKPDYGHVKLIDTNGDGYYDLINITDYEIVVVESIDVEKYIIYGDPEYTPVTIYLDKASDDLIVRNGEGTDYQFDTINAGTVLSVAKSADGKCAKIGYSTTKVTGVLSTYDEIDYYVGDVAYESTKTFRDYVAANPANLSIGDTAAFYLTFDGKLAYYTVETADGVKVGYFYNLHLKSAMDDTLTIRILTDGSSIADYVAANRVSVDGKLYKDREVLADYLLAFKGKIIRYRLNGDGEINYIDTPYDAAYPNPNYMSESDDSLHILNGANNVVSYYNPNAGGFIDKFAIDSRAKCFVIADGMPLEESFVTDISNSTIKSTGTYTITAYSVKTGSLFVDYVVYNVARKYGTPHDTNHPTHGVVTKVRDIVNVEGEPAKKITICDGDQYFEYETEDADTLKCSCGQGPCAVTPLEVGVGDIVTYKVINNMIYKDGVFICYDYSENNYLNPGDRYFTKTNEYYGTMHAFDSSLIDPDKSIVSYTEVGTVIPCYINRIEKNTAEIVFDFWPYRSVKTGSNSASDTVIYPSPNPVNRILTLQNCFTIKVNTDAKTFEPIRFNDIKLYNDGNGEIQRGYMVLKQGKATMLIYYK